MPLMLSIPTDFQVSVISQMSSAYSRLGLGRKKIQTLLSKAKLSSSRVKTKGYNYDQMPAYFKLLLFFWLHLFSKCRQVVQFKVCLLAQFFLHQLYLIQCRWAPNLLAHLQPIIFHEPHILGDLHLRRRMDYHQFSTSLSSREPRPPLNIFHAKCQNWFSLTYTHVENCVILFTEKHPSAKLAQGPGQTISTKVCAKCCVADQMQLLALG